MPSRKCAACGKDPAEGFASVWSARTGTLWYCHPDEGPSCYVSVQTAPATGCVPEFVTGHTYTIEIKEEA